MKKITLDLDALTVESFETTPEVADENGGTVFGYDPQSCPSCPTCGAYTCDPTCGDTCGHTCSCPPRACIGSSGGVPCA